MSTDSSRYVGMSNISKPKTVLSRISQRILGTGQGRTETQMQRDGAIVGMLLIALVLLGICIIIKMVW